MDTHLYCHHLSHRSSALKKELNIQYYILMLVAYLRDLSVLANSNNLQQTETEIKPTALDHVPRKELKMAFRKSSGCALFLINAFARLPKLIVLA